MGCLAGHVELLHPGAEHGPVVRDHRGEHRRHAHHDHHGRDLHLGRLLLKHAEEKVCLCTCVCVCVTLQLRAADPRGSPGFFTGSPHVSYPLLSPRRPVHVSFFLFLCLVPGGWLKKRGPDNSALLSTSLLPPWLLLVSRGHQLRDGDAPGRLSPPLLVSCL